jgi:hypothetical protein
VRALEDIIGQGDDRPPGGWRRRLAWIAAAAVVLAVIAVEHFPRGGGVARTSPPASARGGGPQYGAGEALLRMRAEAHYATGILGPNRPWSSATRVPRTGAQPDWFWPANARAAPILGLPGDRFGYIFTRVVGGWAVQPNPIGPAGCGNCVGPPVPVYYLADRAPRAIFIGSANQVAPGATTGSLWLTNYPAGADLGIASGTARQYSAIGASTGPPVTLPAGYTLTQATTRGLLLSPATVGVPGNTDRVWNQVTRRFGRSFGGVLAVGPTQVAYAPPCTATCPVDVLNLATGREVVIGMSPGNTATTGIFSPDGHFLALEVSFGHGGDGGELAMQIEVAPTTTGHLTVVPRTSVSSDALVAFGWPAGRDDLVTEFSFSTRVQMALWDPVAGKLSVADVGLRQHPTALVVG